MKKLSFALFSIIFVLALVSLTACFDESPVEIEYEINADGTAYTVTGLTSSPRFSEYDVVIPAEHDGLPVTAIGESAFTFRGRLRSVTLPDSIVTIENAAFSTCEGLVSITIPETTSTIGRAAFYGCVSLETVHIPTSVSSLGDSAFSYCISIKEFTVAEDNPAYEAIDGNIYTKGGGTLVQYAIAKTDKSFTTPEQTATVEPNAFYHCEAIEEITFSDSVTHIGAHAVSMCENLRTINLGKGLNSIDATSLGASDALSEINVDPENSAYKSIDGVLFTKDGKTIVLLPQGHGEDVYTVPDGVTAIGDDAFSSNETLKGVVFPEGLVSIGENAFSYCRELEEVIIPNSVTKIGAGAFRDCESITEITLPNSVTSIGEAVFSGCARMKSAELGNGVKSIPSYAFQHCDNLETVNVGTGLKSIGSHAFRNCYKLTTLNYAGSQWQWMFSVDREAAWDIETSSNFSVKYNG